MNLLAAWMALTVAPVQEWDMGPMSMYGGSVAIEYESLRRSRLMGVPPYRGKEAAKYRATRFTRSPAVSARVRKNLVAAIARTDKTRAARFEAKIKDGSLAREFNQLLAPYGFRSDDAADALSAFWIMAWLIANDEPNNPAAARAVRGQVVGHLFAQPAFRTAEARQALGESLVYQFMFLDAARTKILRDGTPAQRAQAATAAKKIGRNVLGVDLAKMRLTQTGFGKV